MRLRRMSEFADRLNTLLQGIPSGDLSAADRQTAVRQAVAEYNQDSPRQEIFEFPGAATRYYMLYGKMVDVDESGLDSGLELISSGAGQSLAVSFSLLRRSDLHQVNLWLSRTGAAVAGTMRAEIYTVSGGLPDQPIAESVDLEIDGVEGAPRGRYARVSFPMTTTFELPAGEYMAVLSTNGYTYEAGVAVLSLGVDSGEANTVFTFDGSDWTAASPGGAGILEVLAGAPGWRGEAGAVTGVEYPAAAIDASEDPLHLEDDQWEIFRGPSGTYLRFTNSEPAANEKVRISYVRPYSWVEGTDPLIDIPEPHFEALCNLAASVSCDWLATRYGQKKDSGMQADSVDRRTMSDQYRSQARRFRESYKFLSGQKNSGDDSPGMTLIDIDYGGAGGDFLFHRRSAR